MHDTFEWWANIWVPALLGAATIMVAIVAAVVSHNASRLARQVESMRLEDQERRDAEAARLRLIDMASNDARMLLRWTVEAIRPTYWGVVTRPLNSPPPRSPLEEARIAASVQLGISLVPGSSELLRITELDLANRYEYLPDEGVDEGDQLSETRQAIVERRDKRMFDRIRSWGLDPEPAVESILRDLRMAGDNLENYLKIGL